MIFAQKHKKCAISCYNKVYTKNWAQKHNYIYVFMYICIFVFLYFCIYENTQFSLYGGGRFVAAWVYGFCVVVVICFCLFRFFVEFPE